MPSEAAQCLGIPYLAEMPSWAHEPHRFLSYFENGLGEPWVAVVKDDRFLVAGGDFDWATWEFTLETLDQVVTRNPLITSPPSWMSLGRWLINDEEAGWLQGILPTVRNKLLRR